MVAIFLIDLPHCEEDGFMVYLIYTHKKKKKNLINTATATYGKKKKLGFLWFYYSNGGGSENSLIITKVKDSDLFENDGKEGGGCHNHNHDVVFLLARIKHLDALCFLCFSLSLSCLDHYEFHLPTTHAFQFLISLLFLLHVFMRLLLLLISFFFILL